MVGRGRALEVSTRRRQARVRLSHPVPALLGLVWMVVVLYPIFYMFTSSLRTQGDFLSGAPWGLPAKPTLANYQAVLDHDFGLYLANTAVVTVLSVGLMVGVAVLAAYAVVRIRTRLARFLLFVFVFGLAIPLQATIIPVYLIITGLGLYDTLWGMVLPIAAFNIPLTFLILVNFIRDIPVQLYESMLLDGAGHLRILRHLVLPLGRPALITVSIYQAIEAWNGFLFPLILTQSQEVRVLPLALWTFRGQYTTDVPAVLAAVFLSAVPMIVLYVLGRRQLLAGLMAGFSR